MHHLPIDQSKVDELIKQCKHFNVFAVDLPTYYFNEKKPNPIASLMADLIAECVQYLTAMTTDEIQRLVSGLPPGVRLLVGYDEGAESDFSPDRVAMGYLIAAVQESYL